MTVGDFISEHKEGVTLMVLAFAASMPPELPYPFHRVDFLNWSYRWVRTSLLTFVSMRGPAHVENQQSVESKFKREPDGSVTASSVTKGSTESTPPQEKP